MPITPEVLDVGQEYTRRDLAVLFGEAHLATSREGYYGRDGQVFMPFFVTLDKEKADPAVAYNDYFEGGLFFWESQHQNTLRSKWIKKWLDAEVTPLLFIRLVARRQGRTQPFVYAGRLMSPVADETSERPVKLVCEPIDISDPPPTSLKAMIEWSPGESRIREPKGEYAKRIEAKLGSLAIRKQGFESNPKVRKAIEMRAMEVATKAYERHGYSVQDVSKYCPYDLLCTKENVIARRVEVKGTRGGPDVVNLTIGEIRSAREPGEVTDLFIVHGISVEMVDGDPVATGGVAVVNQRWSPRDEDLEATQFRYKVPKNTDF